MQVLKRTTLPLAAALCLALPAPAAAGPQTGAAVSDAHRLGANDRGCSDAAQRVMALQRRIFALRERIVGARVRLRKAREALRRAEGTRAEPRARRRARTRRRTLRRFQRAEQRAERRLKRATNVLQRECS